MSVIDEFDRGWQQVSDSEEKEWRRIFQSSREGVNLTAPCPVCGHRSLHRYYHLEKQQPHTLGRKQFIGTGSLWEWCSNCRTYDHFSAAVPDWWSSDLSPDITNLRHHPAEVERARKRRDP